MSLATEVMTVSLMVQLTCNDMKWPPVGPFLRLLDDLLQKAHVLHVVHAFFLFLFTMSEEVN